MSMGGTYYAYHMGWEYGRYVVRLSYDAAVAWFVAERTAWLSFCSGCALLSDEVDIFSHKVQ